jgi:ADP-ribosyl-[dinitrogen reductase] hydrolase
VLGAIAGDIIGSRFEGHQGPPPDFELFHPHCRFTDDTVCGLAVADAIMRKAGFACTLRAFVRRHPDAGYGGMFIDWAFSDDAPAYGSWGNGAPMRVAADGWLASTEAEALDLAAAQAAVSITILMPLRLHRRLRWESFCSSRVTRSRPSACD